MSELRNPFLAVRLIFGAAVLVELIAVSWLLARARRRGAARVITVFLTGAVAEKMAAVGLALYPVLFMIATCFPETRLFRPFLPLSLVTTLTGSVLLILGLALYGTAVATLGASFRIGLPDEDARPALVRSGLYSRVRHPAYSGLLLWFLGSVALYPSAITVLSLAAAAFGVRAQALREEAWWEAHDAAGYEVYRAETGRFLPRWRH